MNVSLRLIKLWLILFIPFFMVQLVLSYFSLQRNEGRRVINDYKGSKFSIQGFLDLDGNNVELALGGSNITIIDFWHKSCPPCITEMKEFKNLIQGRKEEVSIVSISINSYPEWKKLFTKDDLKFIFLRDTVDNWKHLVLKSSIDPKLKNILPSDNIEKLGSSYQTNTFPFYLVLDQAGSIIAAPASAVDYIKVNLLKKNSFAAFLTNPSNWNGASIRILKFLIEYSGYFWLVIVLLSILKRKSFRANLPAHHDM